MTGQEKKLHVNKIAIVGNPNVGKSSLFNKLTRTYSLVANLPHTTIEVQRAAVVVEGMHYEIIDTPGMQALDSESEDGLTSRAILLEEHPEIIILCLDANNMNRSLLLASQIIELEIPLVVCLNFTDESRHKGIAISRKKTEQLLGVPVIETVASEGRGIKELLKALPKAVVPVKKVHYKHFIEEGIDGLAHCFPAGNIPADGILLLLLARSHGIEKFIHLRYGLPILEKVRQSVAKVRARTNKDIARVLFEERNRWAESLAREIMETRPLLSGRYGDMFGRLARHPVWGWLVLIGVMYCTYILVGRIGIDMLVPFFENVIFAPINSAIAAAVPWQWLRDFLVGRYGILTTGLENALGTVLPILTMFFIILNFLEDTGYIANLCVLSNRIFQRLGLSGKAILPIVLGFGCKTMATLTTRILESKKERTIAVFLISFAIPCAPLLGVNLAILALLPFKAFLLVFGVISLVEIVAGLVLNKLLKKDIAPDFIMEIPPVRLPNIKNLGVKTYYRLKWFTVEAVPLFMLGAAILFFIDLVGLLNLVRKILDPVIVTALHLPSGMVDAFLLCLLRLEAGAVIVLKLAQIGELDAVQIVVSILIMNIPCFANTMAIIKEMGITVALWMVLVITTSAFMTGWIVNFILRLF